MQALSDSHGLPGARDVTPVLRGALDIVGRVFPSRGRFCASIAEPAKPYFAIQHWTPSDVRFGQTAWICCTRNVEPVLADEASKRQYVLSDFKKVMGSNLSTRVWLMFTGRAENWGDLGRDEPQIIMRYLRGTTLSQGRGARVCPCSTHELRMQRKPLTPREFRLRAMRTPVSIGNRSRQPRETQNLG